MSQSVAGPFVPPDRPHVEELLTRFWIVLGKLPDLLARDENLLAQQISSQLREVVLGMILAANGIQCPREPHSINALLGDSQRAAIEKTLIAPRVDRSAWISQAVALVVIYRWYAPQLVEKWRANYPAALELSVLAELAESTPEWPRAITTE